MSHWFWVSLPWGGSGGVEYFLSRLEWIFLAKAAWQTGHSFIHSFMDKPLYCIMTNKKSWIFQCFRLTSCWAEYILWTWCLLTRYWVPILVLIAFISFAVTEFTGQCGAIFTPFSHNLTSIEYLCDTANHQTNITICLDYMFGLTDYSYFGSNTC